MSFYHFSIDLGETFTDFVLLDESGELSIKKIPTTFHGPTIQLTEAITEFLDENERHCADMRALIIGISVRLPIERMVGCINDLEKQLRQKGLEAPLQLVTVSGQMVTVDGLTADPEQVVHPSRVGGMLAGRYFGLQTGQDNLILLRVGGTSTYLSLLTDLSANSSAESVATAGQSLAIGGNSYIGTDATGALGVLPEYAPYETGPACFGRNTQPGVIPRPTLTDAYLLLGYINKNYFLHGSIPLDVQAARQSVEEHLAKPLNIRVEDVAMRVCRNLEKMLTETIRALTRSHTAAVASYSILAFGGAGPIHACEIATLLGVKQVTVPIGAGVSSALGYLFVADENDPSWRLPPVLKRARYFNTKEGDFHALKGYRAVYYEQDLTPCSCPIYDRAWIRADDTLSGPVVIEGPETTVIIRSKMYAKMDKFRNLQIHLR